MATPEHLLPLLAAALAVAGLCLAARRRPGAWLTAACRLLALLLVVDEAAWWVYAARTGAWSLQATLPLQLCEADTFVAAAALLTRRQALFELAYFWGLAGSGMALLTPDLPGGAPGFLYYQYYVGHSAAVLAPLLLIAGFRMRPRPAAALAALAVTAAYAALVFLVDLRLGANYMYLRARPATPSLLDLFGPWPWYLAGAAGAAVLLLAALQAPFLVRRAAEAIPPGPGGRPARP